MGVTGRGGVSVAVGGGIDGGLGVGAGGGIDGGLGVGVGGGIDGGLGVGAGAGVEVAMTNGVARVKVGAVAAVEVGNINAAVGVGVPRCSVPSTQAIAISSRLMSTAPTKKRDGFKG